MRSKLSMSLTPLNPDSKLLCAAAFSFYPSHGANHTVPQHAQGQRPSVILRGNARLYDDVLPPLHSTPVTSVYLVYFARIVFEGGGVQYQQISDALGTWPGFFTFHYCQSEHSATPLLDVQAKPGLALFNGLQAITITEYMPADTVAPNYFNDGRWFQHNCIVQVFDFNTCVDGASDTGKTGCCQVPSVSRARCTSGEKFGAGTSCGFELLSCPRLSSRRCYYHS